MKKTVRKVTGRQYRIVAGSIIAIVIIVFITIYAFSIRVISNNVQKRAMLDMEASAKLVVENIEEKTESGRNLIKLLCENMEITEDGIETVWSPALMEKYLAEYDIVSFGVLRSDGEIMEMYGKTPEWLKEYEPLSEMLTKKSDCSAGIIKETEEDHDASLVLLCKKTSDSGENIVYMAYDKETIKDIIENVAAFTGKNVVSIVDNEGNSLIHGDNRLREGIKYYTVDARIAGLDASYEISIDESSATERYRDILDKETSLIHAIMTLFFLVIVYTSMLSIVLLKRENKEKQMIAKQHDSYEALMKEMQCAVCEYDTEKDWISANPYFDEKYFPTGFQGRFSMLMELKDGYPEFDFKLLLSEIGYVIESGEAAQFESILGLIDGKMHWVKVVLMPIIDVDGKTMSIVAAVIDTTEEHKDFREALNMLSMVPGGMHRCHLSEPVHLEWASDGMIRMLGYTREEFEQAIGAERDYSLLIVEEDREKFEAFVNKLAKEGGYDECEYGLRKKDGSVVRVNEIMDTETDRNGVVYGYSAVTDLSEYIAISHEMEVEIEEMKEQLHLARVNTSTGQMQPHFLYNALASIREIVLDDPDYASELIYDFTIHLRSCIRAMSSGDMIPFRQELENIKAYVNIEKMRFGERLKIKYDINESDFKIIPISIQPLVENAIKHGICERGKAGGTVFIRSYRAGEDFVIEVEDDGVGFDYEEVKREIKEGRRDSTGLENLIFRFEKLMNARVHIDSLLGKGTKITVRIPEREEKNENDSCR